ncbi:MAG: ABC transporter ATP-binding protein [Firmicutes bacterium]|nr:ABC transporter ATP-binding protein [Bacillota bacterium]
MMIEAEHLFKRYGTRLVVDDLSLHVDVGDVLGFIGPNGAGKTTTMKMISGVMPPYAGRVRIDGIDIETDPRPAKSRIGFLPENAPLHMSMTVRAFLAYAGRLHGFSGRELARRVDRTIERCALREAAGQEIESLSKGYKRRVCLAQSILHDPKALIMDEPTDGLDPNQKRQIRELILSLREETAVIISTHILEEVDAVCSRVFLLCRGRTLFDGATDEFRAKADAMHTDLAGLFAVMTEGERS